MKLDKQESKEGSEEGKRMRRTHRDGFMCEGEGEEREEEDEKQRNPQSHPTKLDLASILAIFEFGRYFGLIFASLFA